MNKYEKYKNSEDDMYELLPSNWKQLPIRAIFKERNEKNIGPKTDFILSVTKDRGVIPYDEKGSIGNNKSEEIEKYKLVYPNDFVINKMNVVIGSLGLSKYFGAFSHVYLVYTPKTKFINMEYYSYIFSNPIFYKSLIRFCTGIMDLRESINKNDFKNILLPFPPLEEQEAIAKYLDEKTANIEQAISQKERMISLLKEEKQIIIQNAVTKGLNSNATMKDSGIDFIGEIPEHWEVKRLGVIGYFSKGGGFSKSDLKENGCYAVLYGDIYTKYNFKINSINRYISNKTGENSILINEGDILFSGSGETKEDIGKCVVLNINDKVYAGGDVIIFKQKTQNSNYLGYYLNTEIIKNEKAKVSKGEIVVHIYASKLKDLFVCLPPIEEQKEIVDYIETKLNRIDKIIELQIRQIEKLKELKTTLIDNAVTGKIKVC